MREKIPLHLGTLPWALFLFCAEREKEKWGNAQGRSETYRPVCVFGVHVYELGELSVTTNMTRYLAKPSCLPLVRANWPKKGCLFSSHHSLIPFAQIFLFLSLSLGHAHRRCIFASASTGIVKEALAMVKAWSVVIVTTCTRLAHIALRQAGQAGDQRNQ